MDGGRLGRGMEGTGAGVGYLIRWAAPSLRWIWAIYTGFTLASELEEPS